jgi:hypothetical protein
VGVDAAPLATRDTEVEHLHHPILANHHVLGLDVAMDEAPFVRRGERSRHVREQGDARRGRRRSIPDRAAQRVPRDDFHDDERCSLVLADVEDRDHVGVVERGRSPGLAEEPRIGIGVRLPALAARDDLEGHTPPQPGVVGAVDAAHPSLPE